MSGRCRICDYHPTAPSSYHHIPSDKNRVRFYEKAQEFLCDRCAKEVETNLVDLYGEDEAVPVGEFSGSLE
jgi:hypothetical protein